MKTCTKCLLTKELTHFYFNTSRNKHSSNCKDCSKAYKKAIRSTPKHKAYIKKYNKKWRQDNPDKIKHWKNTKERVTRIKREYGVTEDQYKQFSEKQNHSCAICLIHKDNLTKPLYVDHCHETGLVRGLLCQKCNSGIGLLKDSVELLERATSYLKK